MTTRPRLKYIEPNSYYRGVAACLRQPVNEAEALIVKGLINDGSNTRHTINNHKVEYRGSDGGIDILRHVFRWDKAPYDFVFENGLFRTCRIGDNSDGTSFNLEHYVSSAMRQVDIRKETENGFVSTTLSSAWFPIYPNNGLSEVVYRYEIYAPGGILVAQTLGKDYRYREAQDEVAFIYGIAPQYIRSAQRFELSYRGTARCRRVDDIIYINRYFNPQSSPQGLLEIQNPVAAYKDLGKRPSNLVPQPYPRTNRSTGWQLSMGGGESSNHLPLSVSGAHNAPLNTIDGVFEYYKVGVTCVDSYVDAAFRCKGWNQAYIFMKTEYVIINYAPGSTGDTILKGPCYIGDTFRVLAETAFAEYGIDAAFAFLDNTTEAMIFSGNLCARIDYAPFTTNARIIDGPKTITKMFPFLKETNFERGIDAAFATAGRNAYLFKGTEYALIDHVNGVLIAIRLIADGFAVLRDCGFARDIDAAFATHRKNEVYIFKGNRYLKLYYTPGRMGDEITVSPREIVPTNWPSLSGLLPRKNIGLDRLPQLNEVPKERDQDYVF